MKVIFPREKADAPDISLRAGAVCKKYRGQEHAWNSALSVISLENLEVADYMLDNGLPEANLRTDAEFGPLETAVIDGSDFRDILQNLVERRL